MAISTLQSHIDSAVQLQKRKDSAYLVFGRPSAWEDDTNPPNEVEKTQDLVGTIGYKKLSQFSLARPLGAQEIENDITYPIITYKGTKWVLVPTNQAYVEEARWLYVEAKIEPTDFATGMYRQVGVRLGVEPKTGKTTLNLLPSEIKDKGVLYFYENREPQNRTASVYVLEQFIIKV